MPLKLDFILVKRMGDHFLDNVLREVHQILCEALDVVTRSTPEEKKEIYTSSNLKPYSEDVIKPMCMIYSETENKHILDQEMYIKELEAAVDNAVVVMALFKQQTRHNNANIS